MCTERKKHLIKYNNWASVSEPHTCDFNATFSLYVISYIYMRPSLYF